MASGVLGYHSMALDYSQGKLMKHSLLITFPPYIEQLESMLIIILVVLILLPRDSG